MAFAGVDQGWNGARTMAEMQDWNYQMNQMHEMPSAWGVNAMPGHEQMDHMWTSMQPVPLSLAQEVPQHQAGQEQVPEYAYDMQRWESAHMSPPPPDWYPSTQSAETEDQSSDAVQTVADLLQSTDAKTQWITYCVANGVQFALQPDQYDSAFLKRFLEFYKTGLSLAQTPALGCDAVAAAWGASEEASSSAALAWLGGSDQHQVDSQVVELGCNALSDKIQASVTKFLEEGLDEGESEAEDDDMDEVIRSFMGGGPEIQSAPAGSRITAEPFVPAAIAAQNAQAAASAAAVSGAHAQQHAMPPPPPPPPPPAVDNFRQPGVFRPEHTPVPVGFTLAEADLIQSEPPRSALDAAYLWSKAGMVANQAPTAGRNPAAVASTVPLQTSHLGDASNAGANKSLVDCMRELFCEGSIPYDVRIIADDGVMNGHRYFLTSRCLYFDKLLQSSKAADPWQPQAELRVPGVTVAIMKHVLLYIYTNKIDYSLEDRDSLQPQELEYCVQLCEVADRLGLPGLTKLLTSEVLIPVAETLEELDLVQERHRREQRASGAVAALSAAALFSLQRPNQQIYATANVQDHYAPAPVATISLDEQVADTSQAVDHGPWHTDEISDAKTQKLLAGIMTAGSTTVMIRNLPRSVKQKRLLKEIDVSGFADTYDFAYLPSSFGRGVESSGLGYAFVNFEQVESVVQFLQAWHGSRRFSMTKSDAAVTVSVAEHQGKEINVRAWMKKGVRVRNPDLRPFIKGESPWENEDERSTTPPVGHNGAATEAIPDEDTGGQMQHGV